MAHNFVRHITSIKMEQVFREISKELLEHADHMADAMTYTAPSPFVEFTAPAPDVTYTEPDPVIEHATLAPVDVYTTPALVIELMPALVIEYITPSPAVSYPSFFPSYEQTNAAITGLVNPQFSIHAGGTSRQLSLRKFQKFRLWNGYRNTLLSPFKRFYRSKSGTFLFLRSWKRQSILCMLYLMSIFHLRSPTSPVTDSLPELGPAELFAFESLQNIIHEKQMEVDRDVLVLKRKKKQITVA